jgi:NAD(P)H-dependent FMN reductase
MTHKKNVFVIIGSASKNSANQKLVNYIISLMSNELNLTVFEDLKSLPHFDPELSLENTPKQIIEFRDSVDKADAVLICTPEYIFSIPSGLKNAFEWCVSTTIFSGKPVGLITASANGQKGHEELQLIMKTVMATLTDETILLIQGIKGKINEKGQIKDSKTLSDLENFSASFGNLVANASR